MHCDRTWDGSAGGMLESPGAICGCYYSWQHAISAPSPLSKILWLRRVEAANQSRCVYAGTAARRAGATIHSQNMDRLNNKECSSDHLHRLEHSFSFTICSVLQNGNDDHDPSGKECNSAKRSNRTKFADTRYAQCIETSRK